MHAYKKKILIGSCGGLVGSYLSRYYKSKGYYICGVDANPNCVTKFFLDKFLLIDKFDNISFVDSIVSILNNESIDYYIPTHSKEIPLISKYENFIREKTKSKFIVSNYDTFLKLDSKEEMNINFSFAKIPVPRMYNFKELKDENLPVIYKKTFGSGSNGVQVIKNINTLSDFVNNYEEGNFYEYIDGDEYTVDCIYDNDSNLIAYNQRKRLKSMGGAVIITQNDYDFPIDDYIKTISKSFEFRGCVNFQYILKNSTPYFIDVNLRFPSGGLPLTVNSGIDIPMIILDIMDNNVIKNVKSCQFDKKIMYRYFNEIYEG